MNRKSRGLAPWQTRWVALHDNLHLLEVLLEAIAPGAEHAITYWQLCSDTINFGLDLREAYECAVASGGSPQDDAAYDALRRQLTLLQARAQELTLEDEPG